MRSFLAVVTLLAFVSGAFGAPLNLPDRAIVKQMVAHAARVQGVPIPRSGPNVIVSSGCNVQRVHGKSCLGAFLFVWTVALHKRGNIYLNRSTNWRRMNARAHRILSHEIAHYVGWRAGKLCDERCANTVARKWTAKL